MLDWIEWVCQETNCKNYAEVLEKHTKEELEKLEKEYDAWMMEFESDEYAFENDYDYVPSSTNGDYSPSNPWDAPGMSIYDFI